LESPGGGRGVVTPAAGTVILIPFPFSDLSQAKLRPAVILADSGRGDWILCQVTSNPYGDVNAIEMKDDCFDSGSMRVISYARPGKLFTANQDLMISQVATLKSASFKTIIDSVIDILIRSLGNPVK
jgi:mRNA interferase MazF